MDAATFQSWDVGGRKQKEFETNWVLYTVLEQRTDHALEETVVNVDDVRNLF